MDLSVVRTISSTGSDESTNLYSVLGIKPSMTKFIENSLKQY